MRSENGKTYIIAEIGTSHGGSLKKAYALIDAAAESGADCVKFQWVYAKEILHPDTGYVALPGGKIRLYDRFLELEQPVSFYKKCAAYARKKKLDFGCSPFGIKSLHQLWKLNPDMIKIASPELNHFPMLKELIKLEDRKKAGKKISVIISSGVSKAEDIKKAVELLSPHIPELTLLHCITSYPAPEEEYNLSLIGNLKKEYKINCGVSDHSLDPLMVPAISVYAGGTCIEKHITLSKETDGLDDPVALTPSQFKEMTLFVRSIEDKAPELQKAELFKAFGEEKCLKILGSGIKELAPSEKNNYNRTNRSIHYLNAMKAGSKIRRKDIAVLRTEKELSPGISPEFFEEVIGKRLKTDVTAGSGLLFEHLQ